MNRAKYYKHLAENTDDLELRRYYTLRALKYRRRRQEKKALASGKPTVLQKPKLDDEEDRILYDSININESDNKPEKNKKVESKTDTKVSNKKTKKKKSVKKLKKDE